VKVPVSIKVTRNSNGGIQFTPSAYLDDRFQDFSNTLNAGGAVYNGQANIANLDKAAACIKGLTEKSFPLDIHPEVVAALQAHVAQAKSNVSKAGERAVKVDEALRARGLALYPFQKIGVEWLAGRSRALLADDMGLGKTIQALTAIPERAPVVVVGPLAAKGVWEHEVPRWRQDLVFKAVDRKDFRWPNDGEVIFVTYSSLPIDLPKGATEGTVLIADECHKVKGFKSLTTQRFRALSASVQRVGGKVWLLTGSPLLNRPSELWCILQAAALGKDVFGSYDNFCNEFNSHLDRWGKRTWGQPSEKVAECLRKVMIRRLKAEVLTDLPSKTHREIPVSLGPEWDTQIEKCIERLRPYAPSIYEWIRAGDAARE
jgi:SWI/SNF-related matrix-associated actin-dependent regulator 1 of chromatin subfamily A